VAYIVGELVAPINVDTKPFEQGLDDTKKKGESWAKDVGKSFSKAGDGLDKVGKGLTTHVTLPIVGAGTAVIMTAANFEASMNRVRGLTGATGSDLEKLTAQARELGATTQYSASDAADAMGFLAMAGFKVNDILGAMPSVLELAASAQMDIATAADITSNILTGYGKSVEELGHVNDVLVKAMTSANVDLRMLGESMKYVGPVASGVGVQFEEVAAAVGLLGNAGIQGSMAGTVLRGAISRLANPTKQAKDLMAELGIKVTDSSGNLKSLTEIVRELEDSGATAADMMALFGDRAGPGMSALVEQGSEALANLTEALEKSEGAAKAVAEVNMEGAKGAFLELKSAGEALAISVAESGLLEHVTDIAKGFAEWLRNLSETNPELLKTMTNIALVAAAAGPLLSVTGKLSKGIGGVYTTGSKLNSWLKGLKDATPGATSTLGALGAKIATLGATAGPVILATAAIGGLTYAIARSVSDYRELTKEARELDRAIADAAGSFEAAQEKFADTEAATIAAAQIAEGYIKRLEELEEAGLDTVESQREYEAIIKRLKELIPELNIEIDEQTGLLIDGASALREQVSGWKELAIQQAMQEQVTELVKAHTDALVDLTKAKNELTLKEERYAEVMHRLDNELIPEILEATGKTKEEFDDLSQSLGGTWRALERLWVLAPDLVDEWQDLQDEATDLRYGMDKLSRSIAEGELTVAELAKELNTTEKAVQDFLDSLSKTDPVEDVEEAIDDLGDTIEASGKKARNASLKVGEAIGQGLADGMRNKLKTVEKAGLNLVNAAGIAIEYWAQIASPSKKAMGWGRSIAEGLAIGMNDDLVLDRAVKDMVESLTPEVSFTGSTTQLVRFVHDVNFSGLPAGINQTELKQFVLTVLNSPQGVRSIDRAGFRAQANLDRARGLHNVYNI